MRRYSLMPGRLIEIKIARRTDKSTFTQFLGGVKSEQQVFRRRGGFSTRVGNGAGGVDEVIPFANVIGGWKE
jgi:hypothetical protein